MSIHNFNTKKFKRIIETRIDHIKYTSKDITQNKYYRILNASLLAFWNSRVNKQSVFYLAIKKSDISKLSLKRIEQNLKIVESSLQTHNYLVLENNLAVCSAEYLVFRDHSDAKSKISTRSREGMIIFIFGPEGINVCKDGVDISGNNVFYDAETREKYLKKKDMSKIEEVLQEYQNCRLSRQCVYSKFFASKIEVRHLPENKQHTYVLKNRPEKFMRDDLKDFLNTTMQGTFESEMELSGSKGEIDIYIEFENRFYFFELKWLGHSINVSGTGTTPYSNKRAQEGKVQTLEYVEELIDEMNHDVSFGMLLVFDARRKRKKIIYQKKREIRSGLRPKLQHFRNYELFLDNNHPA